jgi:hypothetical protein
MNLSLYDIQIGAFIAKDFLGGLSSPYGSIFIRRIVKITLAETNRRGRGRDDCIYEQYEIEKGGRVRWCYRMQAQAKNMIRWADRLATPDEIKRLGF